MICQPEGNLNIARPNRIKRIRFGGEAVINIETGEMTVRDADPEKHPWIEMPHEDEE